MVLGVKGMRVGEGMPIDASRYVILLLGWAM